MPGPELTEAECLCFQDTLEALLDRESAILVASGSLSAGTPGDFYARVARIAREADAPIIVDSSGNPLREAVAAGVDAIRVNYAEMVQLAGRPLEDDARIEAAGRGLIESGKCRNVVVSLGAGGAIVITPSEPGASPRLRCPSEAESARGIPCSEGSCSGARRAGPSRTRRDSGWRPALLRS